MSPSSSVDDAELRTQEVSALLFVETKNRRDRETGGPRGQYLNCELEIEASSELQNTRLIIGRRYTAKAGAGDIEIGRKEGLLLIQHIECFPTQLQAHRFTETNVLAQSGVPIDVGQPLMKLRGRFPVSPALLKKNACSGNGAVPIGLAAITWRVFAVAPAGSAWFRSIRVRTPLMTTLAYSTFGSTSRCRSVCRNVRSAA